MEAPITVQWDTETGSHLWSLQGKLSSWGKKKKSGIPCRDQSCSTRNVPVKEKASGDPPESLEPFGVALQDRERMETQPFAKEGAGKGPSAAQPGKGAKLWTRTGQKILEEETILPSQVPPWTSIQYREAEGPRGLCSRVHGFCRRWLRPEKNTKAQMLDLVVLEHLLFLLPPEMEGWVRGVWSRDQLPGGGPGGRPPPKPGGGAEGAGPVADGYWGL
ncbi:uncharacterized protein LOC117659899 [Pantherophis guttatus]|uniref:Uncharacterized protein LOC117659899 n=1 Tax=Pantherophis guttatus TaxID=94885 RepID=A0ABM3ZEJ7_PANGU|nr:uncharacterized protein LOC117659899 [Pantherophis guttatus]